MGSLVWLLDVQVSITHTQLDVYNVQKSAGVDVAVELEASEAERLKQVSCEHFEGLVVAPFAELWGVDVPSLTGVTL